MPQPAHVHAQGRKDPWAPWSPSRLLRCVSPGPTLSPQTGAIWLELGLTCSSGRTGGHQREPFKLLSTLMGGALARFPQTVWRPELQA